MFLFNVFLIRLCHVLRVYIFGKLDIHCEEGPLLDLETRKVEEFLCYLLINRERTISREVIAELLWGEINPEQSKNYLRKSLWQLQSSLDSCGQPGQGRFILADSDWVQINHGVNFWLDVAVFEDAFSAVQGKAGRELLDDQAENLKQAIELYRGDLLEGWYQDWCLYERERLQNIYIALLDKMMDFHDAHSEPELALVYGNLILRYDRARERTHRRMMRLYYNVGDRTAGLRQYAKCVAALRDELDVEPAKRTRQLYELIRTDKMDEAVSGSRPDQPAQALGSEVDLLKGVSGNLVQIQSLLVGIQSKLENELIMIQQALKGKQ